MNLIRTVKRVLVETGLYERFEYSRAHRGFTRLFHPEVERSRRSRDEHHRAFLRPGSLVFDVGANLGEMSLSYLRAGCRVVAIEPDERCARILRRRFASKERFALEEVAVSEQAGTALFHVQESGSAYNTLSTKWRTILESRGSAHSPEGMPFATSRQVRVVTLDKLIAKHGVPDYLKIDVEGHEASVLRGLSRGVGLAMFEANLPEFRDETEECIKHLAALDSAPSFQLVPNGAPFRDSGWVDTQRVIALLDATTSRSADIYFRGTRNASG